ncbi:ABC transporter substrate-binding protein [Paenibacillus sacheonensis]|uniref:Extracellular solute-binding protein n=1 Tax=Paenibacillus sacheonensis TaxID=742054 RepID=A0A7X4YLI9_9BACL|nr:ABC transporter substrate-binding protein [Paenibacillus sacheonensis]MBM7564064.1 putative aldouronate transport system substrate-binding protein [Paenibacillus sacheonensis]NBC67604.1 extracellular solute-binding protein [Paenibacillus sacheonensis]
MMKKKKKLGLVLTGVLAASMVLSACGQSNNGANNGAAANGSGSDDGGAANNQAANDAIDTSKAVNLKMVMLGPKPADYDQVFGEINKQLKEKVNATIDAEFLDWSDWGQKYPLKFAAGEDFDLIYTSNWANYNDQSNKGGFLELTDDMLAKYMPQTWAAMPKVKWDQARVNGKVYMVPQNQSKEFTDKLILYRGDLLEKYKLQPIDSPETYQAYLEAVAKNEKGMTPYGLEASDTKMHNLDKQLLLQKNNWFSVGDTSLAFKVDDAKGQVFSIYDTPEFKDLLTYYKSLADNGGWSRNALTNKGDTTGDFKAGKVASMSHNVTALGGILAEVDKTHPEWKATLADLTPDSHKSAAISTQNGIAIHATSKEPERAMMVLDLLQNDKSLHDLIMYGIAGTNYEPVGDDKFTKTDKYGNFNSFSNWAWNSPLNRVDTTYPQAAQDVEKKWAAQVFHYPLETFVFDNSKVLNEVTNVGNVMMRYGVPLEYGLVPDTAKGLETLQKQLKAAGIDKIKTELQSQIDAFLAKQG